MRSFQDSRLVLRTHSSSFHLHCLAQADYTWSLEYLSFSALCSFDKPAA